MLFASQPLLSLGPLKEAPGGRAGVSRQALFPKPAGCTPCLVQAAPLARHFTYGTLASLQPTGALWA